MKIQNLTIIFLAVIIPIIAILSYYLHLQQETLQMQAAYDTKLREATKEGIDAFEINTMDWSYHRKNNCKNVSIQKSDVHASINTFLTSLSNKLNISGTANEYIQDYVPAIVFTGYDGYYIYSQSQTPVIATNRDNIPVFDADNNAQFKKTTSEVETTDDVNSVDVKNEYSYKLNNKTAYSAEYISSNADLIVNYTLDNKIYVYGTVKILGETKYVDKSGRLIYIKDGNILPRVTMESDNLKIEQGINGGEVVSGYSINIKPERLTEQIAYKDDPTEENETLGTFYYCYDSNDEKIYYNNLDREDELKNDNFFTLDNNKVRQFFDKTATFASEGCRYKSVSVLYGTEEHTTEFRKIYQVLNGTLKGKWYIGLNVEGGDKIRFVPLTDDQIKNLGLVDEYGNYTDYSDISYYVEGYTFTNWINKYLGSGNLQCKTVGYRGLNENPFNITQDNYPDKENSIFVQHRNEIIKSSIISSLNNAISNYGRNQVSYRIPAISDDDWNQVLNNVSLITFFQGVPIGLKSYNNYAIATSNKNRVFVDPTEIFFSGEGTFHRAFCPECNNITGAYRSVEYEKRTYNTDSDYYYQHNVGNTTIENACYYCAVNKGSYTKKYTDDAQKKYNEALARERYEQEGEVIPYGQVNIKYSNIKIPQMIFAMDMSDSMNSSRNIQKTDENGYEIYTYGDANGLNRVIYTTDPTTGGKIYVKAEKGPDYGFEDKYDIIFKDGKYYEKIGDSKIQLNVDSEGYLLDNENKKVEIQVDTTYKQHVHIISKMIYPYEAVIIDCDNFLKGLEDGYEYDINFLFWDKGFLGNFKWKNKGNGTVQNYFQNHITTERGGTHYLRALDKAYQLVTSPDSVVVFMSDGQPTDSQNNTTGRVLSDNCYIIQQLNDGKYKIIKADESEVYENISSWSKTNTGTEVYDYNIKYTENGTDHMIYNATAIFEVDEEGIISNTHTGGKSASEIYYGETFEAKHDRKYWVQSFLAGKFLKNGTEEGNNKILNIDKEKYPFGKFSIRQYAIYYKSLTDDKDDMACRDILSNMTQNVTDGYFESGLTGEKLINIFNNIKQEVSYGKVYIYDNIDVTEFVSYNKVGVLVEAKDYKKFENASIEYLRYNDPKYYYKFNIEPTQNSEDSKVYISIQDIASILGLSDIYLLDEATITICAPFSI